METMRRHSTPELVRSIADDSRELVRKEIELARHELVEAVVARAKGAAAFAVAGVLALVVLVFAGASVAAALDTRMTAWQSRLTVAAVFSIFAAGAAFFGARRLTSPPITPEETKRTVKEDIEWAKAQLKR